MKYIVTDTKGIKLTITCDTRERLDDIIAHYGILPITIDETESEPYIPSEEREDDEFIGIEDFGLLDDDVDDVYDRFID